MSDGEIEKAINLLQGSGQFRILRRFSNHIQAPKALVEPLLAVVVDVETTGLDSEIDEIIELGMVKFEFGRSGEIGKAKGTFQSFNDPGRPIPAAISELTGINDGDVRGCTIDVKKVGDFLKNVTLVVAHNAAFDRPFCERVFPGFAELSWACSATEIDWKLEGVAGSRLEYIAQAFGYFYDAHRSLDDCNAVLQILTFDLPKSKSSVLLALLRSARQTRMRVYAEGAPFELRAELKRAGYRWNDGQNGFPRSWWKGVAAEDLDSSLAELASLCAPTQIAPIVIPENARSRFRRAASTAK
jgi:DNA polymerase-3 subunit epsilon